MEQFTPLNMQTWPRAQAFYYYTQIAPTSYTMKLDVTTLRKELKKHNLKFFPAYLYLVTKAIGMQQELRIAVNDGVVGFWDSLTPAYPQFHADDKTTSLLFTPYCDTFNAFYKQVLADVENHGHSHGLLSSKGAPPPNAYIISCIPWFTFESFSLHNHGIKDYYLPSFEAGGLKTADDGKTTMPLSVTVHHATIDGYHLKRFFEQLEQDMEHPLQWL